MLRPGGICYVTTPPRLRFLFGRDPHYGLPGLLLLPDALQRRLFEGLLRRGEPYAVTHTFWSVAGVLRTLPGLELAEVTSKHWAGPLRRFDWDWIVASKGVRRWVLAETSGLTVPSIGSFGTSATPCAGQSGCRRLALYVDCS